MKRSFVTRFFLFLGLLLFTGFGCFPSQKTSAIPSAVSQSSANQGSGFQGNRLAGDASPLLEYSQEDFLLAMATSPVIFLFFYASWCDACVAQFAEMESAFNEFDHPGVVGFRVDINDDQTSDQEKELARQYGVAYDETKVVLKNGEDVEKTTQHWTKQDYLDRANNLMPAN